MTYYTDYELLNADLDWYEYAYPDSTVQHKCQPYWDKVKQDWIPSWFIILDDWPQ